MSENELINDQLVLISGTSGTGKSASLKDIENQDRWMYLNAEAGKRLPFRNKFKSFKITDPYQVIEALNHISENSDDYDGIILDTLTFLMDMYESQYVIGSSNTMQGWANYNQFFKNMMQTQIAALNKPVVILAHTRDELDEKAMEIKTSVPIKGALKNQGIEAYFSTVVSTKKVPIKELDNYKSDILNITEKERMLGFKHVFQTQVTKTTLGERIRSPMGMFDDNEVYMDNNVQLLLKRLNDFYNN